jgi:5-methylcytosine-specific restriction endonuclease McrA
MPLGFLDGGEMTLKCKHCDGTAMRLEEHELHGYGAWCIPCDSLVQWMGKGAKRKKSITYARTEGDPMCVGCGITKSEAKHFGVHVEGDHLEPLEFGGKDKEENIRPLCSVCHQTKTARQRWARGAKSLLQKKKEGHGDLASNTTA